MISLDHVVRNVKDSPTIKAVVPQSVRSYLGRQHRHYVLMRAMRQVTREPEQVNEELLDDLIYGWGNEGWSAQHEYLAECWTQAAACNGAILECGSGLTTLLLGAVAGHRGQVVWALEHNREWGERVRQHLKELEIDSVRLFTAPLRDYGTYHWYDPPLEAMPEQFELVVCDGPPSDTPGGRYGLLPVMRGHLRAATRILLDDAARPGERDAIAAWKREVPLSASFRGDHKCFSVLTLESLRSFEQVA